MKISDINGEAGEIRAIHAASGFDYICPNFPGNPRFPIQRVISNQGQFIAASLVKVEAEVYLFMNHEHGTPEERWQGLQLLHADVVNRARIIGFDSLLCAVPPEIEKSFGPRLKELGWDKDRGWPKYVLELR
jgi:hypothetical protein